MIKRSQRPKALFLMKPFEFSDLEGVSIEMVFEDRAGRMRCEEDDWDWA